MKKLPEASEMLVEAFREFNSALSTLNDVLGVFTEKQQELADNLNKYQEQLDAEIFKTSK